MPSRSSFVRARDFRRKRLTPSPNKLIIILDSSGSISFPITLRFPISPRRLAPLAAVAVMFLHVPAWAEEAIETDEALDRISVTAERG